MRILIIGGMHGNETLGIELVESLLRKPIEGIDSVIANEQAVSADIRFTGQDLNRSFPGDANSKVLEERRAAELMEMSQRYDLILDFHNTWCPGNDCSFVGGSAQQWLFAVSGFLGLKRVIVADYECMNKYAPNCISVEISMQSELNNVALWREKITSLTKQREFNKYPEVERYKFMYRMTLRDRDCLGLDTKILKAFKPLDPELADAMNVGSPAYPIFIGDKFTPYNYGGILNRID